jgi:hypothetical protein
MYFEVVVGLFAAAVIPLIIKNERYSVKNIYAGAMGVYALVLGVSGVLAFDSSRAFWSNFERMTGIVFIWCAILFSVLATAYLSANITRLRGFLSYLAGISVIVAMTGIAQRLDPTILMHQGTLFSSVCAYCGVSRIYKSG